MRNCGRRTHLFQDWWWANKVPGGFFAVLVGEGCFLAELPFQAELYKGQGRADCSVSINLPFSCGCPEKYWLSVPEPIKVILRKNFCWIQETVIPFLFSAIPWQHHGPNCFLHGRKIFLNDHLYSDVALGFPLQLLSDFLSTHWLCASIIFLLLSF